MASYSKLALSSSTNGKSIVVSASAAPYTLLHTTGVSLTTIDELYIYASNNSTYDSYLTLYWGSSAAGDLLLQQNIQAYAGQTVVIPGLILTGSGTVGSSIYVTTTYPNVISITGYVNRIS